jgi:small subunit ribosomal protein S2
VVDTKKEHIAVSEARKLGIPVIAILDTNCDPDEVTYPIPGNDDAIRSVSLLTRVVADAVADGLIARAGAADGEEKPSATAATGELGAEEPLPEWERELLEHSAGADGAASAGAETTAAEAEASAGAEITAGAEATAGTETTAGTESTVGTESTAGADGTAAGAEAAPEPDAGPDGVSGTALDPTSDRELASG